eukprot:COSAG03_NODE_22174_length_294_cov_1.051282_1_plen_36_part_01
MYIVHLAASHRPGEAARALLKCTWRRHLAARNQTLA